jgi:signal transduction histidine kinase
VLCSPGAIAQVITNIIENALVHAFNKNESGEINIALSNTDTDIIILISDNGQGMTEDVLDCIFDPFFTTNRENGGSGLGMHLVYNIVTQQLNGTINCSSIMNEGTQFIIKFPFVINDL